MYQLKDQSGVCRPKVAARRLTMRTLQQLHPSVCYHARNCGCPVVTAWPNARAVNGRVLPAPAAE